MAVTDDGDNLRFRWYHDNSWTTMEPSIKPYNAHIAAISLLPCHFPAYQFIAFPIEHRWIDPACQCYLCLLPWRRELNVSTSTGFRDVKSLLNKHTGSIPTGMKSPIHNLQQNPYSSVGQTLLCYCFLNTYELMFEFTDWTILIDCTSFIRRFRQNTYNT